MEALKKSRALLAVSIALALTACSEEAVPPEENTAPSFTLSGTSVSVNEGATVEVPFTLSDSHSSVEDLTITIDDSTLSGDVSIDKENMVVRYVAPWIREGDGLTENFNLTAKDPQGASTTVNLAVDVQDINSPVSVKINPPQNAISYQNTQTDSSLSFVYPESSNIEIVYDLEEEDADYLSVDFSVSEGVIFKNQVTPKMSDDGTSVSLSFPVPDIANPSEIITVTLSVMDGDETVTAVSNITVANKVSLAWTAQSPMSISEENGGTIQYTSSEGYGYTATYTADVTLPDGSPLDFPLDYTFNSDTGEISFSPSTGFLGDRSVLVTVKATNELAIVGGESYVEETVLTRSLTVKDDRDDGFSVSTDNFYQQVDYLEDVKFRRDEDRVASTLGTYLFLNRYITHAQSVSFSENTSASLNAEYAELDRLASDIANRLDSGESGDEIKSDMSNFESEIFRVGAETRKTMREEAELLVSQSGKSLPLSLPYGSSFSMDFGGRLTHFVGNDAYGYFADDNQQSWIFKSEFSYLDAVNIENEYCF